MKTLFDELLGNFKNHHSYVNLGLSPPASVVYPIYGSRHCEPKKQACIAEEEADSDDACPCCGLKMTDHHTSHKTTTSHKDEFDLLKVGTRPFTTYICCAPSLVLPSLSCS